MTADELPLALVEYDKLKTGKQLYLRVDASLLGIGGYLAQGKDMDHARLIRLHSRKFTPTQQNYDTREHENFAIVETIKSMEHYLVGCHFTVITDHESLTRLFYQQTLSRRQIRWMYYLNELDFDIVYAKGAKNILADFVTNLDRMKRVSYELSVCNDLSQCVRDREIGL